MSDRYKLIIVVVLILVSLIVGAGIFFGSTAPSLSKTSSRPIDLNSMTPASTGAPDMVGVGTPLQGRDNSTPAAGTQSVVDIKPEILNEAHDALIETQRATLKLNKEHAELEFGARNAKAKADAKKAELEVLKAETEMDYIRTNPKKWFERQGNGPAGSAAPPDATAMIGPLGALSPPPALPGDTPVVRMAYIEDGSAVAVIAFEANVYRVTAGQRVGPYTVKTIGSDYVDLLKDGKLRRVSFGMSARSLAATADREPQATSAPGASSAARPLGQGGAGSPPPDSTSPALRMP